jgi:hypothetical protein
VAGGSCAGVEQPVSVVITRMELKAKKRAYAVVVAFIVDVLIADAGVI